MGIPRRSDSFSISMKVSSLVLRNVRAHKLVIKCPPDLRLNQSSEGKIICKDGK